MLIAICNLVLREKKITLGQAGFRVKDDYCVYLGLGPHGRYVCEFMSPGPGASTDFTW